MTSTSIFWRPLPSLLCHLKDKPLKTYVIQTHARNPLLTRPSRLLTASSDPHFPFPSRLQFTLANTILERFQTDPRAWTRVPTILQHAQHPQTKRFALTVMENLVRFRWNSLPADQQINIREYMIGYVMELSANPELLAESRLILDKANGVVVSVRDTASPLDPSAIADGPRRRRFFVTRNTLNFFLPLKLCYIALPPIALLLLTPSASSSPFS